MKDTSRGQILRAHYVGVLKRAAAWLSLGSLLARALAAGPAQATGQLTSRTTKLGNSKAGATTTYSFTFTLPTGGYTAKSVEFQVCTSPLETTSCSASNSSSLSGASLVTSSP